eukprot:10949225-Ditylum_brightwellii.AAC.1
MKCRNVALKADDTKYILLCCPCLSSKSNVIHTVYVVFEDKLTGKYLQKLSSCSCKRRAIFCSHSIGLLNTIIAILQQRDHLQYAFETNYRVSPLILQGVPMLIENAVMPDTFLRELWG